MKALLIRHNNTASIMVFDENGEVVEGGTRKFVGWDIIAAVMDAFDVQEVY